MQIKWAMFINATYTRLLLPRERELQGKERNRTLNIIETKEKEQNQNECFILPYGLLMQIQINLY